MSEGYSRPLLGWRSRTRTHNGGTAVSFLVVFLAGLAIGAITNFGQGVLPDSWNTLANSGAVWLVFAFFLGSFFSSDRSSAMGGALALIGALVGYYGADTLLRSVPYSTAIATVWLVTACIGGPIAGVAGHCWRSVALPRRVLGISFLCAVPIAEGVFILWRIENHRPAGFVELVAGITLLVILGRSWRERLLGLLSLVPVALIGLGVYEFIDQALAHV